MVVARRSLSLRGSSSWTWGACFAGLVCLTGCSSVTGSAVRTGAYRLAPRTGAHLYTPGHVPEGKELGIVMVRASGVDATIDTLTPEFVRKAASLGGNAAVLENVSADFSIMTRPMVETYAYPCGYWTCTSTRMTSLNDEVVTITLRGRAMWVDGLPSVDEPAPHPPSPPPPPAAPAASPASSDDASDDDEVYP